MAGLVRVRETVFLLGAGPLFRDQKGSLYQDRLGTNIDDESARKRPLVSADNTPHGRPLVARWSAQETATAIGAYVESFEYEEGSSNRCETRHFFEPFIH